MRDPLARIPIKYKLTAAFVGICLLAFGVGGYLVSDAAQHALEREIMLRIESQAENISARLDGYLQLLSRRSEDFASDGFIRTHAADLLSTARGGDVAKRDLYLALKRHLRINKFPLIAALAGLSLHDSTGRNIAGVGIGGDFLSTPVEDWHWVIGINLMGVVHGCKVFAPPMVTRKSGHIVNIASAAGYYALPDMTAYSASKHAVMGLTESLRAEFAPYDIGVSAICPGVINTNIVASSRMHGSTGQSQQKLVSFYKRRNYGPEHVARAVADAIRNNKAIVPVSPEAWVMYEAKRFTPGLMDWMAKSPVMRKLRP